jgi:phenylalanyl-tRNA synthetase beta chain
MLCAPDEMGFGDDHAGIMILAPDAAVGTPLTEHLGIEPDVLFDLEVNPNRPDAMSVAGVARDLAARQKLPFAIPQPTVPATDGSIEGRASVEIVDPDLCGRFVVRVLEGVHVGESPGWMQRRLLAAGMRPISSVVDASNYVMLELGQPNHTYDLALVPDGHLGTRWARDGERLVTLDGVERTLTSGDGVIVDRADQVIGLAGVMGGASTEISDRTTAVLLEMAWWNPMAIARTSTRLGLRSEASMRFERGSDPEVAELAAARFCELLEGARPLDGIVDVRGDLPDRSPVRVRTSRVNQILGTQLTVDAIRHQIEPIGFECRIVAEDGAEDDLDVVVPSFRPDTSTEIDVIEEVARHLSYSAIPKTVPKALAGRLSARQQARRQLQQVLLGLGVDEAMPMPFLAPGDVEKAGAPGDAVSVANPLDANESVLRTSLRPGLLKALAYNASHRIPDARLFELGRVFLRPAEGSGQELPDEPEWLAVGLAGAAAPDAVGVLRVIADALGSSVELRSDEAPGLHPTRTAAVSVDGRPAGHVGEIDPAVAEAFDLVPPVAWLELEVDALLGDERGPRQHQPISTYPSSDLDLAFEVDDSEAAGAVEATIRDASGELLASLSLFDVYRGTGVGEGKRSLAYRLRLQADDRTLTDAEIGERRQQVIDAVEAAHPATLRG